MQPFAAPKTLPPGLARARAYWEGLLRGAATIPFWDDFKPGDLGELQQSTFTLEVFERPQRQRFGLVGEDLKQYCGTELAGTFLDEGVLPEPFVFLLAQGSATIEGGRPTLYRSESQGGYSRLLLPMWGEGRVGLLLGVIEWS